MVSQTKAILGITPRIPNKKKNLDSPITVWNIHSLSKLDLQSFGLVLYDEADKYLASPNFRHALNQVDSEYAYAVTGTIKVNGHPDNLLSIYYGAKEELIMKHMTPAYVQAPSKFQEYSFEHFADLSNKLYQNEERNDFIVDTTHTYMQSHNKAIVFTRQIEHAKLLQEKFQSLGYQTYMLIGEVPQDERELIRNSIINYP
jgi:superfamily II DNA or RNA helicase